MVKQILSLQGKHSGTLMCLLLPALLWMVQATTAMPSPPEWVYVSMAAAGVGFVNHFTDQPKGDG
jgi:hypothetical protein